MKKKKQIKSVSGAQPLSRPLSSFPYLGSDISFESKRLNPIDVILVDKQSRLTLTKKVKRAIPLNPEDKIAVYQDIYNKDIVLKVQYHKGQHQEGEEEVVEEKKLEKWVLTIRKEFTNQNDKNTISNTKNRNNRNVNLANENDNDDSCHHGDDHKTQESYTYKSENKENPLYSTPILLVDDDSDSLMTFKLLLKNEGYNNIKAFSSSNTTLKHLLDLNSRLHYKLAIIDVRMPDINGIQLYQILKILNPSVKIMFFTGLDAVDEMTSIYHDIRPTDILRKPIEPNLFVKAVNDKVLSIVAN
jgi:CheY-like chemotaxis protein